MVAQSILSSQQVQGSVQVHVNLVYSVPDGLQGHPPVRGLGLLMGLVLPGGDSQENGV